ncbi:MAG TPA: dUTP diphosphatase [Syntrophales bacterium]|nr:dUTP diphosphatase [Syntrophales bacterium]
MIEEVSVFIRPLPGNEDIPFPHYMTEHAAGMDVFAAVTDEKTIAPGEWMLIPAGIAVELPQGFEAEIRPRSGLALKYGITLLNTPGTIDADYRGEVGMIVINHGKDPFMVRRGDRIAQMVVHRVCRVAWQAKNELELTSRGEGGFGHTK